MVLRTAEERHPSGKQGKNAMECDWGNLLAETPAGKTNHQYHPLVVYIAVRRVDKCARVKDLRRR
jgi:hypothetical protein